MVLRFNNLVQYETRVAEGRYFHYDDLTSPKFDEMVLAVGDSHVFDEPQTIFSLLEKQKQILADNTRTKEELEQFNKPIESIRNGFELEKE